MTSIGSYAFRGDTSLTSVTIPNSVTTIGNYAFYNCSGLTSVTIGNSVTSIGNYAFYNCSGLTSVTIGNSVASIGGSAFGFCSSLTSITVDTMNTHYDSRNSCNAIIETASNTLIAGSQNTVIPNSVASIGGSAFSGCSGLTSVTIPNSVTTIGNYAFKGCSGLTSVTIPNSVTTIGNYAFEGCSGLTSVTIPNSVTSIGSSAFSNVRHIEYHGNATGAPWGALSMNGFIDGDFVFTNAVKDTLIGYIGVGGSVTIPSTVRTINAAFRNCSRLTSVTFSNSVTCIGDYAFYYCSGLTSVTIGNSVTTIGNYAFKGCSGLTSVTIGNSVASIGGSAFSGCSGLTSVTIPNSVTTIGNYAFYNVRHIEYHGNATGAPWGALSMNGFIDGDFVFTNAVKDTLIGYIGVGGSVTIPSTVRTINAAFRNCSGLTSVTIPNSVTCIGDSAFYYCSGLTSVTIPNSVTSIGGSAFYQCSGLTSVNYNADSCENFSSSTFNGCNNLATVNIGINVRLIPQYFMYNRTSLASVTIGSSVTHIGSQAFYRCTGLRGISSLATVAPTLGSSVFANVSHSIPVQVPCGSQASYTSLWSQNFWSETYFSNIIESLFSTLTVQSADSIKGRVTISTQPSCSRTGVIVATANYGYHFTQWNDGNTNNPRTFTLTQDTTFTAMFSINQYSVTGMPNDSIRGTVTVSATVVDHLDTVTLTATANYGYHFTRWNDGDTCNPRRIAATSNITKTAIFDFNQYALAVGADTSIHGYCSGGGTYNYLSQRTITANANYGYHFTQWNDGDTNNPRIITLTQDTAFTALFVPNQYTLTLQSNDSTQGSVIGGGVYNYLDTAVINAAAIEHHHLVRWNDGNRDNSRQVIIVGDTSFTAYFAIDTHTVSVTANDIVRGAVNATGTEFVYGTPCTVSAGAYTGYVFSRWSNGVRANPYTFAVMEDTELTAIFLGEDEEEEGIGDVSMANNIRIYVKANTIHLAGVGGQHVIIYGIDGRTVASLPNATEQVTIPVATAGVYLVKVGTLPVRKVVVLQ